LYNRSNLINEEFTNFYQPAATEFPLHVIGYNESILPHECDITKAIHYMELAGFEFLEEEPGSTSVVGINFPIILGILAFIGGTIYLVKKRRNRINLFHYITWF
jgi:LPXTG-motif cell wall-anchored protein